MLDVLALVVVVFMLGFIFAGTIASIAILLLNGHVVIATAIVFLLLLAACWRLNR
jgi:hypothetical protein